MVFSPRLLKICLLFVCLVSGIAWLPTIARAKAVDLTGNWNYRESGGGLEKNSLFSQGYSLGFGKELTRAMRLGTSVSYNESVPSGSQGKTTDLSPSASVDLVNDLFSTNLNVSHAESSTSGQNSMTSDFWGVNLFSNIEDWPGFRVSFNQGKSSDSANNESESYSLNGSVDHTFFKVLDTFYSFQRNHGESLNSGLVSQSQAQQVQGRYSQSFWDGRVALALSHQWSGMDNEDEFEVDATGRFFRPAFISEALSAADDTPAIGTLTPNAQLIDGDERTPAGVELVQTLVAQNLGVHSNFQPVQRIRIHLDQEVSLAVQGILNWEIYEGANGSFWSLVVQALAVSYVEEDRHTVVELDLPVPVSNRYVKAVCRASVLASVAVNVTEIEAGSLEFSDQEQVRFGRSQRSQQSSMSLAVRPRDDLNLSLSLNRSQSLSSQGADSLQMSGSLSANYAPSPLWFASAGYSRNLDETSGFESRGAQGYSLSLGTSPLDALDLSLGYTRSESLLESTITNRSDSVSANLAAVLYPDLTLSVGPAWTVSRNLLTDSQGTAWGLSGRVSAKLSPKLGMNFNAAYSLIDGESSDPNNIFEATDSYQYGLSFNYNPSDVLVFSFTGSRQDPSGNMAFSGSTAWRITRRLQAAANAAFALAEKESSHYGASISWLVTDSIAWRNAGSLSFTERTDSWGYQTSVNANF